VERAPVYHLYADGPRGHGWRHGHHKPRHWRHHRHNRWEHRRHRHWDD
jgi:hypothetical protein